MQEDGFADADRRDADELSERRDNRSRAAFLGRFVETLPSSTRSRHNLFLLAQLFPGHGRVDLAGVEDGT